jgi:hypothetical protein
MIPTPIAPDPCSKCGFRTESRTQMSKHLLSKHRKPSKAAHFDKEIEYRRRSTDINREERRSSYGYSGQVLFTLARSWYDGETECANQLKLCRTPCTTHKQPQPHVEAPTIRHVYFSHLSYLFNHGALVAVPIATANSPLVTS